MQCTPPHNAPGRTFHSNYIWDTGGAGDAEDVGDAGDAGDAGGAGGA